MKVTQSKKRYKEAPAQVLGDARPLQDRLDRDGLMRDANVSMSPGDSSNAKIEKANLPPFTNGIVQKLSQIDQLLDEIISYLQHARQDIDVQLSMATLLSVKETARRLSCSECSVHRYKNSGELRTTFTDSHPRFRPADIAAYIDSRAHSGPPSSRSKRSSPSVLEPCLSAKTGQSNRGRSTNKKS
jgi:hypothetical protein